MNAGRHWRAEARLGIVMTEQDADEVGRKIQEHVVQTGHVVFTTRSKRRSLE